MGSEFKIYNNALYDACEDEQPMFCPDVQRGSLHGIINPLFADDMEVSDAMGLDANLDALSYYCSESDCCFSVSNVKFSNDMVTAECEDEVFDGVIFEEKPTLHGNVYNDSNEVNTNRHFSYEDTSAGYELFSECDEDVMCKYESDSLFDIQPETLEEMQSPGEFKMHDIYNLFCGVENEDFVFQLDSMHDPVSRDEFQFNVEIH